MLLLYTGNYLGKRIKYMQVDDVHISLIEYAQPDPFAPDRWHAHDNAHITFFIKGGTQECRKNQTYDRVGSDIAFYHIAEPHLNKKTLFPSQNLNIELGVSFLKKYQVTDGTVGKQFLSLSYAKLELLQIYRELQSIDTDVTSIHSSLLSLLLEDSSKNSLKPGWIKSIKEYLHDNWYDTPSLDQLAAVADVHPVTISKKFSHYFHCTLGEYLRKLKIENALSLVQSGKLTMEEIGYTCGFADKSHFNRVFKEQTGFLPGEYQRLSQA